MRCISLVEHYRLPPRFVFNVALLGPTVYYLAVLLHRGSTVSRRFIICFPLLAPESLHARYHMA